MTQGELLRLIDEAAEDGRTTLDLSGQELDELPPEIGKLTNLKTLVLGRWDKKKEEQLGVVHLCKRQRKKLDCGSHYLIGLLKMAVILHPLRNSTTQYEPAHRSFPQKLNVFLAHYLSAYALRKIAYL